MEPSNIGLILVKAETTYLTDPTPTIAANALPVLADPTFEVSTTRVSRKILDGTLDRVPGFNVLPNVTLKFRYELRGNLRNGTTQLDITNGTSTQAVEIHALLAAANLTATYTAAGTPGSEGSSAGSRDGYVTYKPARQVTQGSSVTVYWYSALKLHKLLGGKVTFTISAEAGKPAYIDFTVRGKYVAVADATFSTTGWAPLTIKPPQFILTTGTMASYTPVFSRLSLDLGNEIAMREDALQTDGVAGFIIGDRMSKGEVNPDSVAEATHPWWADWIASTVKALTLIWGGTAGNKLSLVLSTEQTAVKYADANRARIQSVNFDLVKTALDATEGSDLALKFF